MIGRGVLAEEAVLNNPSQGLSLTLREDGTYQLIVQHPNWAFSGSVPASATPLILTTGTGEDKIGRYQEVVARTTQTSSSSYSVRLYDQVPVLLFKVKTSGVLASTVKFPVFSTLPPKLMGLSYLRQNFSPITFTLAGDAPWAFFDEQANTFILSPASHFMISNNFRSDEGQLSVGIEPQVNETPDDFEFSSILAFAPGINSAFEIWGRALTALSGKKNPSNDSDSVLSTLGYWTDNRFELLVQFQFPFGIPRDSPSRGERVCRQRTSVGPFTAR